MRYCFVIFLSFCSSLLLKSQDSLYTRSVIKDLCSEKFYGRGYLKNGLDISAKYLSEKIKENHGRPLFSTGYFQWFDFDVNTFPDKVSLKINGKLMKPGVDYLINPSSKSMKGKFELKQIDSISYFAKDASVNFNLHLKDKLTFSVATYTIDACNIELISSHNFEEIKTAEINIQNKLLTKYITKNVCSFIEGTTSSDSMIVFTAHYDHLGGLGKNTFFPGANDNASGVSMLLNLMRYYDKNPPKYRTLFLFFAGEEAGLIGSKHFVQSKVIDLSKVKFLINLDLLGTGSDGIMVVNGSVHNKEYDQLVKINKEKNLVKEVKKRGKAKNSDHFWFTEAGVPCFFIYTMGGISAYHDVYDLEKTLPLTEYKDVFELITEFVRSF